MTTLEEANNLLDALRRVDDPRTMSNDEVINWVTIMGGGGYSDIVRLNEYEYVAISKFLFTYGIIKGVVGESSYNERWCYHDHLTAQRYLALWLAEGTSEPQGWHRHVGTGRRRPDGDPEREYIQY